jgi:asparagine synthase (glutamine-hydrolysing)
MCGLFGAFNWSGVDVSSRLARLAHRGPDGAGVASAGAAVHGHVRLALVDLTSASDQPFRYAGAVLSFNGEIWNWREVRHDLQALGRTFSTNGDTEVLAQALDEWSLDALPRLQGMFAFAWSSRDGRHVLVRDRFGEVPLYVARRGDAYLWSSERKAFDTSEQAIALPAGTLLDMASGILTRWYDAAAPRPFDPRPIAELLARGVTLRATADAPVCCLISGGLDSTLILHLAHQIAPPGQEVVAYTAKLDSDSADLRAARRVTDHLGVRLIEVPVQRPDAAALSAAVKAIEIPSKAQVEIAAMCMPLAAAIASDGFKACLSGEAADELFGGYGSMHIKGYRADDDEWRAVRLAQLAKMARGNFVRCNKVFMAYGVECRLPFMEQDLVEATLAMSKAQCPPGKGALKAAAEGLVPRWVIDRQKDTFQGGAGMIDAAQAAVSDPRGFYASTCKTIYGPRAKD